MSFFYEKLVRPSLFQLETEKAHDFGVHALELLANSNFACKILKSFLLEKSRPVELWGLKFPNVIGQAAGLDKDGRFPRASEALGFGHIEVGTVTPLRQDGNEKPRLFRVPKQRALINRMGFNNLGAENLLNNILLRFPKNERSVPLGINLGKGKNTPLEEAMDDYKKSFFKLAHMADYITINISSPNTPGLRKLHLKENLAPFLQGIKDFREEWTACNKTASPPCLLKISPDENYVTIETIVGLIRDFGFDGIVASNTSVNHEAHKVLDINTTGGLSGRPIGQKSNEIINFISKLTNGNFPIIGCGGIHDYESARRKLDAGANLLQLYTGFIYEGPFLPNKLSTQISKEVSWV